ncbi:MAG TPA: SIMPL domain-containing protein [Steroidobacteraceae bacterium]|nr:SIMPL domain-containing protein [Steroidobacteraceae bacterium]
MEVRHSNSIIAAAILAVGICVAAFIAGVQLKNIGAGRQSISVKGLAEKPVTANSAEWTVTTTLRGASFAEALTKLRAAQPKVRAFLTAQGFDAAAIKDSEESVRPHMEEEEGREGRTRYVQKGFAATQSLIVTTPDLAKIQAASKAILQFEADGNPVEHQQPLYMISNLEEIKMSLIGAATLNALQRAEEFAKNGNAKVGSMRSASQGAFYILPAGASVEVDDYGGRYDKSTVDKLARVVVTIEYNISQ